MSERRCRQRRPVQAIPLAQTEPIPMEAPEIPMNRYISARSKSCSCVNPCDDFSLPRENHVLLEQLVELSVSQNQLLVDILGAINSLTATLLTARLQP